MRFVIVTGMSGAGKSTALKILEDAGYFCVDNLPVPLILKFAEISWHEENMMSKVALGIDIRSRNHLNMLEDVLKSVRDEGYDYEILFMDCKDDKLIKRYKETRRNHPLAAGGRIETAIAEERQRLSFLKKQSDYIIDTSNLLIRDLKKEIQHIFVEDKDYSNFYITLLSFGFKYGIPADADLVFDVRFLPNPYYVENLKQKTGLDPEVQEYVMGYDVAHAFLAKLEDMVEFLLPNYVAEGKNQLVIAIGCTGGKHRSVTLANALYEAINCQEQYGVRIEHRDIEKDAVTKAR